MKLRVFLPLLLAFFVLSACGQDEPEPVTWSFADGVLTFTGEGEMPLAEFPVISEDYVPYDPRWHVWREEAEYIVIEKGITSISDSAFYDFENLIRVELADSIETIGHSAFAGCTRLAAIELPRKLRTLGFYAFRNCQTLTDLHLPRELELIGDCAFDGCSALKRVTVSRKNAHYQVQDGVLYTGDGTVLLWHPPALARTSCIVPEGVTTIARAAFADCATLQTITLPDSLRVLDRSAFSGCATLQTIQMPDTMERIGEQAFGYCAMLTAITIPEGVTGLGQLFRGCSALREVCLPSTLQEISDNTFAWCDVLTQGDICFAGTEAEWRALTDNDDCRALARKRVKFGTE